MHNLIIKLAIDAVFMVAAIDERSSCVRHKAGRSLVKAMRSLRQVGIVILLLVSYLTPAMACMVSDAQMNTEERACCRSMKNQCEQMEMPASHGCCQKASGSAHDNALDTKDVTYHPDVVLTARENAAQCLHQPTMITEWLEHPDYSPPKPPPGSISVLRI